MTYDPDLLTDGALGALMQVRLLIGDTDAADEQLSDEEIGYLLEIEGDATGAARRAATVLAAKYARLVDKAVGDLRVSLSQRAGQYRELAKQLAGDDVTAARSAPWMAMADLHDSEFVIGMHDAPGSAQ